MSKHLRGIVMAILLPLTSQVQGQDPYFSMFFANPVI